MEYAWKSILKMKEAVLGKTAYGVSTLHPVSLTQYSYKTWIECIKQLFKDSER